MALSTVLDRQPFMNICIQKHRKANINLRPRIMDASSQVIGRSPSLTLADVDKRWKYRAGWPPLCRLPAETVTNVSDRSDLFIEGNLKELWSEVNRILAYYQIEARGEPHTAVRTQKRLLRELPRKDLRIFVDCVYNPDRQKENPDSWALAVIEIRKVIKETVSHPHTDIGIELCDMEYESSIRFTDVPPSISEFQKNWTEGQNYEQRILAEFNSRSRLWQVMTLVGLEASNQHCTDRWCAVWFDAINADDPSWQEIEQRFASILPADIQVEIWQAAGELLSNGHKVLQIDDFTWPPLPGASIGPKGMKSSGTLGGYVRVREPITDADGNSTSTFHDRIYGVTNAHVALHDDVSTTFQEIRWNRNSIPAKRLHMQSPSYEDRAGVLNRYRTTLKAWKKSLFDYEKDYNHLQASNDPKLNDLNDHIRRTKEALAPLQRLISMAKTTHSNWHVTSLAFGKREQDDKPEFEKRLAMDIALIDVTQSVQSPEKVFLPKKFDSLPCAGQIWTSWGVNDLTNENFGSDMRVLGIYGRTSGFSKGILHGIKVNIDLKLKNPDGTSHYFSAYAIRSEMRGESFSSKGDSGSFVFAGNYWSSEGPEYYENTLADNFVVVGMLFADSASSGFGYFIPFDALVAEIESLTGGKVTWPPKCA